MSTSTRHIAKSWSHSKSSDSACIWIPTEMTTVTVMSALALMLNMHLLASNTRFDFIVTLVPMYFYLSHMADVTTKLQGRAVDIISTHQMILAIMDTYKAERAGVEKGFEKVYQQALRMARQVGTQPFHPRSCKDKRLPHRSNAPAETSEQ